jgi:hypothetical protein
MKRTKLYKINEVLEKFAIMDYSVNAGLYSNTRDLLTNLKKYKTGLYYTELEIISAIKSNGTLIIYNGTEDLELVEQVFTQEGVDYEIHNEKNIKVRTYITALRAQLYAQQDEKLQILLQKPDIQIA